MSRSTGASGFETIIGLNTINEGDISTKNSVRIEGKVIGNINAGGDIYIGKKAEINGNLSAKNVYLCGTVTGQVKSQGLLKLQSTAKLTGDITINSFVADEGSLFQGSCIMTGESTGKSKTSIEGLSKKDRKKARKHSVLEDLYTEENKENE